MGFLTNSRRFHIFSNIAQVILIVLIFPLIAWLFNPSDLNNFISSIPIFEIWYDILIKSQAISADNVLTVFINSFFEAIIMALCIRIFKALHDFFNLNGTYILATFAGVMVAVLLFKALSVTGAIQFILYLVICVVGISFMFKAAFGSSTLLNVPDLLKLLIESVLAVIVCCYTTALIMTRNGELSIGKFITISLITALSAFLTWLVTRERRATQ